MKKSLVLALMALVFASSAYVHAVDFDCGIYCPAPVEEFDNSISVGPVFSYTQSPYKSHDGSMMVAPLLLHDSRWFYLRGSAGGIHLFNNGTHKISAGVSYFGLNFDRHDTDNRRLRQLDNRRSTLMGEVSYTAITPIGLAKVKVARDVLGLSDGYLADASFGVPWITDRFTIMPSAGVTWSSRKQADYYYGISGREARRSGLKEHTATANFSPYLKLEAQYNFTERISAVAGADVQFLTSKVKDSPMVGRSSVFGGFIGGVFKF